MNDINSNKRTPEGEIIERKGDKTTDSENLLRVNAFLESVKDALRKTNTGVDIDKLFENAGLVIPKSEDKSASMETQQPEEKEKKAEVDTFVDEFLNSEGDNARLVIDSTSNKLQIKTYIFDLNKDQPAISTEKFILLNSYSARNLNLSEGTPLQEVFGDLDGLKKGLRSVLTDVASKAIEAANSNPQDEMEKEYAEKIIKTQVEKAMADELVSFINMFVELAESNKAVIDPSIGQYSTELSQPTARLLALSYSRGKETSAIEKGLNITDAGHLDRNGFGSLPDDKKTASFNELATIIAALPEKNQKLFKELNSSNEEDFYLPMPREFYESLTVLLDNDLVNKENIEKTVKETGWEDLTKSLEKLKEMIENKKAYQKLILDLDKNIAEEKDLMDKGYPSLRDVHLGLPGKDVIRRNIMKKNPNDVATAHRIGEERDKLLKKFPKEVIGAGFYNRIKSLRELMKDDSFPDIDGEKTQIIDQWKKLRTNYLPIELSGPGHSSDKIQMSLVMGDFMPQGEQPDFDNAQTKENVDALLTLVKSAEDSTVSKVEKEIKTKLNETINGITKNDKLKALLDKDAIAKVIISKLNELKDLKPHDWNSYELHDKNLYPKNKEEWLHLVASIVNGRLNTNAQNVGRIKTQGRLGMSLEMEILLEACAMAGQLVKNPAKNIDEVKKRYKKQEDYNTFNFSTILAQRFSRLTQE